MKFQRICAYPHCHKIAEFPAPRSPHKIKERVYFCLDHVKEYNKKWNGLEGFTGDEIFTMQQGSYWNRPTWAMGVGSRSYQTATAFETLQDPFEMFATAHKPQEAQAAPKTNSPNHKTLPGKIREACQTLGAPSPTDPKSIKLAYRKLAKEHHPDLNKGDPASMERIKRINEAYKTLLLYAKKNG